MSTAASTGAAASTGGEGSTGQAGSTGGAFAWGDGWRAHIAAGNADELKRLERFQAPENIYNSYRELERQRSSGELRPVLKKDASPEEQARWRADMGIPADPKGYKITVEGKAPPKEDDPFLQDFLKRAHAANYTQGQVDSSIAAFYAEVDRQEKAMSEGEKVLEQQGEDKLRAEWGADYRTNKAMAEAALSRAPAGMRDRIMNGYLADRTPIRASPDIWKWLVQMEREANPAATVVPGHTGDVGKTIAEELKQYKQWMAAPPGSPEHAKYWKDEAVQARYRDLLDADAKLKAKAA